MNDNTHGMSHAGNMPIVQRTIGSIDVNGPADGSYIIQRASCAGIDTLCPEQEMRCGVNWCEVMPPLNVH